MTRFYSHVERPLSQLAHLHALQDSAAYAVPAYRKRDLDLRKRASFKGKPNPSASDFNLLEQIAAPSQDIEDNDWFSKRWALGEETAVQEASERIAKEAQELGTFGLKLLDEYGVTASAPIRWSLASGSNVLVTMGGTGYHVLLACIASSLRPTLTLEIPSDFDKHVLELHIAATILVAMPEFSSHVDPLLKQIGRALLPQPGSEGIAQAQLERLAEATLEQARGEVQRIASGMHMGRTDRLHRAWSRGFFLPRGTTLEGLLEGLS